MTSPRGRVTFGVFLLCCFVSAASSFVEPGHIPNARLLANKSVVVGWYPGIVNADPEANFHGQRDFVGITLSSIHDVNDGDPSQNKMTRIGTFPAMLPLLKRLKDYVLPPVPFLDTSKFKRGHRFGPAFVVKEAILGAQVMMRLYCTLVLVGYVFGMAANIFPRLPLVPNSSLPGPTMLHILDKSLQAFESPTLAKLMLLAPIIEELVYRGIGFVCSYVGFITAQWFYSTVGGFSAATSLLVATYIHIGPVRTVRKTWPLVTIVRKFWLVLVPGLMQLYLHFRLLQKTRTLRGIEDSRNGESNALGAADQTTTSSENELRTMRVNHFKAPKPLCKRVVERAVRFQIPDSRQEDANNIAYWIHRRLLLIVRWQTSSEFAAAHLPHSATETFLLLDSKHHYLFLRKFWGVFCSSFLVESRLVANRGNLWGAMGAHFAYNAISVARLASEGALSLLLVGHLSEKMQNLAMPLARLSVLILFHQILADSTRDLDSLERRRS